MTLHSITIGESQIEGFTTLNFQSWEQAYLNAKSNDRLIRETQAEPLTMYVPCDNEEPEVWSEDKIFLMFDSGQKFEVYYDLHDEDEPTHESIHIIFAKAGQGSISLAKCRFTKELKSRIYLACLNKFEDENRS